MKLSIAIASEKTKNFFQMAWRWSEGNFVVLLGGTALVLSCLILLMVVIHFQFGRDIWVLGVKNPETAQFWGQIGDFVGGLLNPVLSFFALMAVLFNLVLQRKELSLARKDAKDAHDTQKRQSEIFEMQNFESVFFRLLDAHSRLAVSVKSNAGASSYVGMEGFDRAASSFLPKNPVLVRVETNEQKVFFVSECASKYVAANIGSLGHYFRSLYQILKYIDNYGQVSVNLSEATMARIKVRRAVRNYYKQRTYSNMLRAQLSNSEILCVFLNCLTPEGAGLKSYVEKYSFLKTLKLPDVYQSESVKHMYHEIAYADSEEVTSHDIAKMSKEIYFKQIRKEASAEEND